VNDSFPELWSKALAQALPSMRMIASALRGGEGVDGIDRAVGDGNLSDGSSGPCHPRYRDPLPLFGLMGEIA
jgi:hypothetical protein